MSVRFLLDTNVLSEPLRPQPNENVLRRLREHQNDIATATLVWHELLFGCYRLPISARRTAIEDYLFHVVLLSVPLRPYDEAAARWHAEERARLTGSGRTPPFADGQIAAIAATQSLILVTRNTKDYQQFNVVEIADWFE